MELLGHPALECRAKRSPEVARHKYLARRLILVVGFDDEFTAGGRVAGGDILNEDSEAGSGMNGCRERVRDNLEVQAALIAPV